METVCVVRGAHCGLVHRGMAQPQAAALAMSTIKVLQDHQSSLKNTSVMFSVLIVLLDHRPLPNEGFGKCLVFSPLIAKELSLCFDLRN